MITPDRQPIRVLLIDDHDVVRVGLRMVIESRPHIIVVAEASSRDEAVSIAAETDPAIILLDIDLNGEDGIDLLPELFAATSNAQIILITGDRNPNTHRRAVRLGARGVVLKDRAIETVANAIERVYAGEVWLEPTLIANMLSELSQPGRDEVSANKSASLTAREREVVELVCKGLRNLPIAERLMISEATVRHHLTSIFSKLEVSDRVELVIYAYENGLVPRPR